MGIIHYSLNSIIIILKNGNVKKFKFDLMKIIFFQIKIFQSMVMKIQKNLELSIKIIEENHCLWKK